MKLDVQLRQDGPIRINARLQCGAGELLALVGASGAGKSTVLRAIAGLTRIKHGTVNVAGECWQSDEKGIWVDGRKRAVGIVFQSYALFPHLSVLENVGEAVHAMPRPERLERARQALARVHLSGVELRRPATLSGGQQQRVALARALVREPKVLLLDEPFAAVDQMTRERLYEELAELRSDLSIPVVLVTHSMAEARLLADRMTVIDLGTTLQDGTPAQVLGRPATPEVARLVGFANVFHSPVLRVDIPSRTALVSIGEERLAIKVQRPEAIGQTLRWCVASTHIFLSDSEDATVQPDQGLNVRLDRAIVMGDSVRLRTECAEGTVLHAVVGKQFFADAGIGRGDSLRLGLPTASLIAFE